MKIKYIEQSVPLDELLAEHRNNPQILQTQKLNFLGVDSYDVYNVSQAFTLNSTTYIAGRVEKRDNEISSIQFFKEIAGNKYEVTDVVLPYMQDPGMTRIDDEIVIGGTEIAVDVKGEILFWYTAFYKGRNIYDLHKF